MITFALYASACALCVLLNATRAKQWVCLVCCYATLAGLVIDPIIVLLPPLVAYLVISTLNATALIAMPYVRTYLLIPVLFLVGIALCFYGALGIVYNFDDRVPYFLVTHTLNMIQIVVLVAGSDRGLGVLIRYRAAYRSGAASSVHDLNRGEEDH